MTEQINFTTTDLYKEELDYINGLRNNIHWKNNEGEKKMDVTKLVETNLGKELVRSSPTKKLVILSGGALRQMPDGKEKLSLLVEIDGRQIQWIPNKTTMKSIMSRYGSDSSNWVGKQIEVSVGDIQGKEGVIGKPI